MADPLPIPPARLRPFPVALGVGVLLAVAALPLVPEAYRPWNFVAYGAVALFVAARGGRFGLPAALAVGLGAKLGTDAVLYAQSGYDPDYVPSGAVYACLAVYAGLGWACLRGTRHPVAVGGTAFLASAIFFLVTNAVAWREPIHGYPPGLDGLLQSYAMGLQFWTWTLIGDLGFTAVLFLAEALVASAASAPGVAAEPARIPTDAAR